MTEPSPIQRLQQRLAHDSLCPKCRYRLNNLTDVRCPECGFVLAAELIPEKPPVKPLLLWAHRALGTAAFLLMIVFLLRCVFFTTPTTRPSLLAAVPIFVCFSIWIMHELAAAYLTPTRARPRMDLLLAIISALTIIGAWRWV